MSHFRSAIFLGGAISLPPTLAFYFSSQQKAQQAPPEHRRQKITEIFLAHLSQFLIRDPYTRERHIDLVTHLPPSLSTRKKDANYRPDLVMPITKDPVFIALSKGTYMFAGAPNALLEKEAHADILKGRYLRCQAGNCFNGTDLLITGTRDPQDCHTLTSRIMNEYMGAIPNSSR